MTAITTTGKIKKFMTHDFQWVDLTWLIFFIVASVIAPYALLWTGNSWTGGEIWITDPTALTWFSITSSVIGLTGAYFMLRKNKWAGPIGAVGEAMLGVIYWINGLYAMGVVNMVIAPMIHIWMFISWHRAAKGGSNIEPKHLTTDKTIKIISAMTVASVALGSVLVFTPGGDPSSYISWMDSIVTIIYIGAILLGVFMYKEQYWMWLLMDVISIIYVALQVFGVGIDYNALYMVPTFVLILGYGFTSVWGHFKWGKK